MGSRASLSRVQSAAASSAAADAVRHDDPRLSGGSVPAHASTHAAGGSDVLTPLAIGARRDLVPTAVKTGAYTAVAGELVMVNAASGPITITLPSLSLGAAVAVKKTDATANVVTIAAAASQTIGGQAAATTTISTQYQIAELQYNSSTNWAIVGGQLALPSLDARYLVDSVVTKTAAYTLTDSDSVVIGNTTTAGFTLTLPTAVGRAGRRFLIKKIGGNNPLTIASLGGTIDQQTTEQISMNYGFREVISDGTNWAVTGGKVDPVITSLGNVTNGSTLTIDASAATVYRATATGATFTLGVPTNPIDGDQINVEILASVATSMTIHASILLTTGVTTPIAIASGKRWFGGLRYITGVGWFLLASTTQS